MSDRHLTIRDCAKVFLKDLVAFRPRLLVATFALFVARALSEGLTFLLLVPLLKLADGQPPPLPASAIAQGGWLSRLPHAPMSVGVVLGAFLGLMLLRAGLGYASQVASATFLTSFVDHVRQRLYRALSRANWTHLARSQASRDLHALTVQCDTAGAAAVLIINLASATVTVAFGAIAALVLAPRLTLAVLAACAVMAIPMSCFQRRAFVRGAAALRAMQTLFDTLQARMAGLKLAKAFAIERQLEADFAAASRSHSHATLAVHMSAARASLMQEIVGALLLAGIVLAGGVLFKASSIELMAFVVIFARLTPLVLGLQTNMRALAGGLPEYEALRARESEALACAEPLPDVVVPMPLRATLALNGVSHAYAGHETDPVVRDVTLSLQAGSAIGMVGLSGAGKSTLADILAGLTPPSQGSVSVDGVILDAMSRQQWRASVAYVTQDAPLFYASLRDNIRLGARAATDAEIWDSLEIVRVAEMVRRLPQGLDTMAGDNGVRFSGGERQRIRLASALLRRPQLLILDESTSALNPEDESRVVAGVQSLRAERVMTILIIAHRPSSVAWTDRVLLMRGGRVVADGPPSQVLAADHRGLIA